MTESESASLEVDVSEWHGSRRGSQRLGWVLALAIFLGFDSSKPTPVAVEWIPGGTIIHGKPPIGWSHLIVKSEPRLDSGDTDTLPEFAAQTASMFRTVLLADVQRIREAGGQVAYRLSRLGRGLCVPFQGRDEVVTGSQPSRARDVLGFLETQVLRTAEAEMGRGRIIGRSRRVTIYSTPVRLCRGGRQTEVDLIYALSVEPETGSLTVVVWADPLRGQRGSEPTGVVVLDPGLIYPCGLDVKATRLVGTLPVRWDFAMRELPPGRRLTLAPDLSHMFRHGPDALVFAEQVFEQLKQEAAGDRDRPTRRR